MNSVNTIMLIEPANERKRFCDRCLASVSLSRIDLSIALARRYSRSAFINSRSLCRCGSWLEHPCVQRSSHGAADNRRDPEQPKLCRCPTSDKDRRAGTPSGVYREVCNRDSNEMNQG